MLGFKYFLRGKTGKENVLIVDGISRQQEAMSKEDKLYEALNSPIIIKYTKDNGDLIFHSDTPTTITVEHFETWNCGSESEDNRCNKVRNGNWAWKGTYIVTFNGKFRIKYIYIFQ